MHVTTSDQPSSPASPPASPTSLRSVVVGFRSLIWWLAATIAIVLIPLVGFISMHVLGETDNGASLAICTFSLVVYWCG